MRRPAIALLYLLCAALPAMAQGEISPPTDYRPQSFDVISYDAEFDFRSAPQREMTGVCTITFVWRDDPSTGPFYFHLRDLRVDSVAYDGLAISATAVGDPRSKEFHYRVEPLASSMKGDTVRLRIDYSGSMTPEMASSSWGGVRSDAGTLYGIGVGLSADYVSTTQHWLPCYDHPSDKATFRARFLVPASMNVASNGVLREVTLVGDSLRWYEWSTAIPTATYLLTFAVGPYVTVPLGTLELPMVIYSKPIDSASTAVTFRLLPRMVDAFARRFVPYPFEKVGYVNTTVGAMEHQTMITFPVSLSRTRDTVNSTGAHELAHQWFGDLVTPLDYSHVWLTESFATFCESVWNEELFGFAGYVANQNTLLTEYLGSTQRTEGILPLFDFPRASPSSNYPRTVYNKGAIVVGMLRHELGDSLFFAVMQEYLRGNAYGTSTTDSLVRLVNDMAGRSLDWFFDQWVIDAGWPDLRVGVTRESGGAGERATVAITQTPVGTDRAHFAHLPVEIGFIGAGGEATYRLVDLDQTSQSFTFDSLPPFTSVTINQGPTLRALLRVSSFASVERGGGRSSFLVHPNPVTAAEPELIVEAERGGGCDGITYEIYDSVGERVSSGRADACRFAVPVDTLSTGSYVLRIVQGREATDVTVRLVR